MTLTDSALPASLVALRQKFGEARLRGQFFRQTARSISPHSLPGNGTWATATLSEDVFQPPSSNISSESTPTS